MRQINPRLEVASGEYDIEKLTAIQNGHSQRITIPIIEKRLGLTPKQLANYRANYLSYRIRLPIKSEFMKKNLSGGVMVAHEVRDTGNSGVGIQSQGADSIPPAQPSRTPTFQAFLDSLKTSPRKVVKLSLDYATRK